MICAIKNRQNNIEDRYILYNLILLLYLDMIHKKALEISEDSPMITIPNNNPKNPPPVRTVYIIHSV